MEFINSELIIEEKIGELSEQFSQGELYKHLFIENFLDSRVAMRILAALKKEKFERKESDLFSFSQTGNLKYAKNRDLKIFYEFMSSEGLGKWIERISGIKLKIGKIDMFGSLYESCDYLLCHDDLIGERRIAFIYYLSDFADVEGGALIMYDCVDGDVGEEVKRISPAFNSILMFEVSEKSFHSVEEVIKGERWAIGGWWY